MTAEDKPLEIQLMSSDVKCAGMAAAYICRFISSRAGRYAPGIHEQVFASLNERHFGLDIDGVIQWFRHASDDLFALGYRLCARRVAFRTPMIEKWVSAGNGFRAAVLMTDGKRFHNGKIIAPDNGHAVGLIKSDRVKRGLEIVDPWPGVEHHRPSDATLEVAHRGRKYGTVLVFWSGHS